MSKYDEIIDHRVPIEEDNPAIWCDDSKCKKCKMCQRTCQNDQGVFGHYDLNVNHDYAVCMYCGQCTKACPFGALQEVDDTQKAWDAINDPDKITVFSIAPAVRVALGEVFKMPAGTNVEGKFVTVSKMLGADYVTDVTFGADLTIMEEAHELLDRIQKGGTMPMFTSCCPGWVKFVEMFYPEMLPHLSSCMSPIAMQNVIIKTYFAKEYGLDPKKIVNITIAPCTGKKAEGKRSQLKNVAKYYGDASLTDSDVVLTTREFGRMIQSKGIDFTTLEDGQFDSLLSKGSSAGLIFGKTGGVMEAALRTAYFYLNGKNADKENFLNFENNGLLEDVKEATVDMGKCTLNVCVVMRTNNMHTIIEQLKSGEKHYDFIEVMACKGGCIDGGGQPKYAAPKLKQAAVEARANALATEDKVSQLRLCHENPEIQAIYKNFLGEPGSERAHSLLHTSFFDDSKKVTGK